MADDAPWLDRADPWFGRPFIGQPSALAEWQAPDDDEWASDQDEEVEEKPPPPPFDMEACVRRRMVFTCRRRAR